MFWRKGVLLFFVELEEGKIKLKFLSCSDLVTKESLEKAATGMTMEEVVAVIGPPSILDRREQDRKTGLFTGRVSFDWKGYGVGATLIFKEDKVAEKSTYAIPLVGPGPIPAERKPRR